jgi:hypothetical protein
LHAPPLHTSPKPHVVPFGSLVNVFVEVAGSHTWHLFAGFGAPAG